MSRLRAFNRDAFCFYVTFRWTAAPRRLCDATLLTEAVSMSAGQLVVYKESRFTRRIRMNWVLQRKKSSSWYCETKPLEIK